MSFKSPLSHLSAVLLLLVQLPFLVQCQPMAARDPATASLPLSSGGNGMGGGGGGGNGGTTPPPVLSVNEVYFQNTIRPLFLNRCGSCHNEPRLVTGVIAPLTIYNYKPARSFLSTGGGALNNSLIMITANLIPHTGGNSCLSGLTSNDPVCGKIIEWWRAEFPTSASGIAGQVTSVSTSGLVNGWALDPVSASNKLNVVFYLDAPADANGIMAGSQLANLIDLGPYSGNYFSFQIPANLVTNKTRRLYAYVGGLASQNLLPGMPLNYAAYRRTTAGDNFFNTMILPSIQNQCLTCHGFNIESAFNHLLSPTPADGGLASNNGLINRASGGLGHPFNGCPGGSNSGMCLAIRQWWDIEFGP